MSRRDGAKDSGKRQSGSLAIVDLDIAAEIATWLIENKKTSWSQVEQRLRRLQPTLSRLQARRLSAIRESTCTQLRECLRERGREDLELRLLAALYTPDQAATLYEYCGWVRASIGRDRREIDVVAGFTRYLGYPIPLIDHARLETGRSGDELEQKQHQLMQLIFADDECRRLGRRFVDRALKQRHDVGRIDLALARAVAPFFDHVLSSGIERSVNELTWDERRAIVKLGLAREEIMLARKSALTGRIQEFEEWLEGESVGSGHRVRVSTSKPRAG